MISVLTLTYQRHDFLEEAIQSFLLQDFEKKEMVIVNDCPDVKYRYNHPKVKIYNLNKRFFTISKKLEWGFKKCNYEFIYRLDDDDLLAPDALNMTYNDIKNRPGFDVYRSKNQYFFMNNKFENISSNVNNGNVYSKSYIKKIIFPDKSFGEDVDITFGENVKIYQPERKPTMIYRWGMNTYHVSGLGDIKPDLARHKVDGIVTKENGIIKLNPNFKNDYYSMLP